MLILIFSGGNEYKLFIVAFQVCRKLCRLEQPYFSNFLSSNVYYLAFFFLLFVPEDKAGSFLCMN